MNKAILKTIDKKKGAWATFVADAYSHYPYTQKICR